LEKINWIDKSLVILTKMRREKTKINKIRNKKGEKTTNTKEIQVIIRDYFESLYSNKGRKDKSLGTYDQLKLNQEDTNHLNRFTISNEIEAAIKCLPTKESPGPDGFTVKFHQTFGN
jgi:hypothetical protein